MLCKPIKNQNSVIFMKPKLNNADESETSTTGRIMLIDPDTEDDLQITRMAVDDVMTFTLIGRESRQDLKNNVASKAIFTAAEFFGSLYKTLSKPSSSDLNTARQKPNGQSIDKLASILREEYEKVFWATGIAVYRALFWHFKYNV